MATNEVVSFDYNHGENGDNDEDNEMEDSQDEENITDPKLYKATLCQFYLKGPCKNG